LVHELRLNELQQIIEAVNQNKSGSKKSLRKLVLSLFIGAPPPETRVLEQKILQVYNSRPQQDQQSQQPPQVKQQIFLQQPQNNLQMHSQSYTPSKL